MIKEGIDFRGIRSTKDVKNAFMFVIVPVLIKFVFSVQLLVFLRMRE